MKKLNKTSNRMEQSLEAYCTCSCAPCCSLACRCEDWTGADVSAGMYRTLSSGSVIGIHNGNSRAPR